MKRALTLLLFFAALPSFARVVSYAPYTTRTALPGYHERTSRYFVLVERTGGSDWVPLSQVVLYDSTGAEEPRVIYPQSGSAPITFAALYEPKTQLSAGLPVVPWLLVGNAAQYLLSTDGGTTWKMVTGLKEPAPAHQPRDVDIGGPFVQGLAPQVMTGNDEIPFVVAYDFAFAAIRSNGVAFPYFGRNEVQIGFGTQPPTYIIGRDAAGEQFLVDYNAMIMIVDVKNVQARVMGGTPPGARTGWITPQGAAYVQVLRTEGRFLYLLSGSSTFIAGPEGVTPPNINDQPRYLDTMAFFAVPTHDFSGAWMIQRGAGKPTKLLRHTPGGTIEQMWSDVTGPQVEALIAGASGDTVLIQVHRPRDVALERPFIDPALAVWHVGRPAPEGYDELYLNESWNKGFVHVDVDRLESGDPFVFNSGFDESPGDIIVSPAPPGGGADVIQEWGVVRASLKQRLVFPGAARLRGAFDSYWLTDVTMLNPIGEEQDVEVRFVALGQNVEASGSNTKTLTLKPWEIRLIPDALNALFGLESGGGTLHFIPESGINVTGRTYTRRADGGTLGFGTPAIDFFNAAGPRFPMTFAGAFPGLHFRTNILLTDTSGRGSAATMNAFGSTGAMGASNFEIAAPVNGTSQLNGLETPLGLFSNDRGGLIVRPTRGTLIPTVVAIDNRTNDATYFPPDIPATVPRMIPIIGHLDGAFGSRFRSDLYLINPTSEMRAVTLEAKQWDSALRKNIQFQMLPNEARVIPDVLSTLFGMTGVARLHYQTAGPGEGVRVTSRTYTIEESGATYGSLIPPLNNFQIAAPGDRLEILGVNAGANFRANIGLVELSRNNTFGATDVHIRIFDDTPKLIDSFRVSVPNTGGMQINDIFGSRGLTAPNAAFIIVENAGGNPGGLIGAYVTLTDNKTNDTTYLGAQLGARPN